MKKSGVSTWIGRVSNAPTTTSSYTSSHRREENYLETEGAERKRTERRRRKENYIKYEN